MNKNAILLIILFLFSSCESQIGTAIGTAITNVVTGKAFGSGGDEAYADLKTENDLHPYNPNLDNCKVPDKSSLIPILSKIKDKMCTCQTWGTCDAKSCGCNILCPNNFSILNRSGTAKAEDDDNSLSFTNSDQAFYRKDSNYAGYCWGHATITQRFNRLAKFNGNTSKVFPGKEKSQLRRDYYKQIIAKINENMPVDIPGFKNLKDFSSDPEVRELLQEAVKNNWAENAMSTQGLKMVASSESQGSEYYNKLFDDVEYRLNNFQQPTIVFNQEGNAPYSHAVLISGSGRNSNGERYLCLRDNNYEAFGTINCKKKMIMKSNGTIYYEGWYSNVGKIVLAHNENANTVEQVKNLRDKCKSDKGCSAE